MKELRREFRDVVPNVGVRQRVGLEPGGEGSIRAAGGGPEQEARGGEVDRQAFEDRGRALGPDGEPELDPILEQPRADAPDRRSRTPGGLGLDPLEIVESRREVAHHEALGRPEIGTLLAPRPHRERQRERRRLRDELEVDPLGMERDHERDRVARRGVAVDRVLHVPDASR